MFKAPQRKFGMYTLIKDVYGMLIYLFKPAYKPESLRPVTICTGLYNRSDMYLNKLLERVNQTTNKHLITLSVFDCGSTDLKSLEESIRKKWAGKLVFCQEKAPFSRAFAFNKAVNNAPDEIIFICDADMWIPENIVELCNNFVGHKRAWYPIVFTLYRDKPPVIHKENGFWMIYSGKGMLACLKNDYQELGGLNEKFTEWGAEDDDLWERMVRNRFTIIRNKQQGLIHHWHQSFNPRSKT